MIPFQRKLISFSTLALLLGLLFSASQVSLVALQSAHTVNSQATLTKTVAGHTLESADGSQEKGSWPEPKMSESRYYDRRRVTRQPKDSEPAPSHSALHDILLQLSAEFAQMRTEMDQLKQKVASLEQSAKQPIFPRPPVGFNSGHLHYHYHYLEPALAEKSKNLTEIVESLKSAVEGSEMVNSVKATDGTVSIESTGLQNKAMPSDATTGTNETSTSLVADSINNFDLAICEMKANHHIPLLNQQDISGRIKLWQEKSDQESKIYAQIQLKGFKVFKDDTTTPEKGHDSDSLTTALFDRTQYRSPLELKSDLLYGMHVHESADMSRDCQSTGNHYNPTNVSHGTPDQAVRHAGDLGNIAVQENGEAQLNLLYSNVALHAIVNRSLVIRNIPDSPNITSGPGVRIACCVIKPVSTASMLTINDFIVSSTVKAIR